MTRIMTNVSATNGQRNLAKTGLKMGKTLEKLAGGYRINRAADDAAGLAISEKDARPDQGQQAGPPQRADPAAGRHGRLGQANQASQSALSLLR